MNKEDLQVISIDELEDGGAVIHISITDKIYDTLNHIALKEKLTVNELLIKILKGI